MRLNIIIFIVLICLYLFVILFSILKLEDIKSNPQKYEEEDLVNATNNKYAGRWNDHWGFFKSLSHQYGMVTFLFTICIALIGTIIIILINKLNALGNNFIFMGTSLIGSSGLFFIGIPIGMGIIPLSIKRPFFVVTTLDIYNTEYRPKIYYKSYLIFLISFVIIFPFIILSCNNYGYYNDEGIYSSRYFQIKENYTAYEEIKRVEIYVSHDNNDSIDSVNYIIHLNDGKSININSSNSGKKIFVVCVIDIHKYLVKKIGVILLLHH